MRDQAEKLRQLVRNKPRELIIKKPISVKSETNARVIAVTSGKGGVGKTNFTANLALAMAAMDKKVLVIDADLGLANVDVILGVTPKYSMMNLLQDGVTLNDIVAEGPRGIRFMSGGSGISRLANLTQQQLQYIVEQITQYDSWADIILLDTGAGLSRNVLNFVMAADEVIVITTPEPTAITDAYAMMKVYANQKGTAPLKIVVNRVIEADEGQTVVDKLLKVSQRFLGLDASNGGFIYEDPNLIKAVKNQTPVIIQYPNTTSVKCIEYIARRLLQGENIQKPQGIKGFFNRFLEMIW